MLDVAVVGGGPAGLYTAMLLAEEGVDVAVLEEHAVLGAPTHCTGVISDEVSSLFKVPENLVLNRPTTCSIVGPSGRAVALPPHGERIAVIDREQFDAELAAAALRAGAEVRLGFRVDRLEVEPGRVCVTGAADASLEARACVLACGVGYRLPRQLGLGLPALALHSAQLEVDAVRCESAVELHLGTRIAPEGFAWVVPVQRDGRSRLKVGVMARGDADAHLASFLRGPAVRERLGAVPGPAIRRLLPLGPIARTYADRAIAVGDAAGLTKPTTGGGIFYSLLSGALAAETLIEALRRDRLEAVALRSYERRWRARLESHLRVSRYLRQLFAKLRDDELETLTEALASDDVQELIRLTADFNWHGALIRAAFRQPKIKSVLLRALVR